MKLFEFNKLKNLISEQIVVPSIKFIPFTAKEMEKWKDCDEINLIRPASQIKNIMVNDLIKADWRNSLSNNRNSIYK
jgi:hypothetical protein